MLFYTSTPLKSGVKYCIFSSQHLCDNVGQLLCRLDAASQIYFGSLITKTLILIIIKTILWQPYRTVSTHIQIMYNFLLLALLTLVFKRQSKTIKHKKVMKLYLTLLFNVITCKKTNKQKNPHTFLLSLLSFSLTPFSQLQFFCSAGWCSKLKQHRVRSNSSSEFEDLQY